MFKSLPHFSENINYIFFFSLHIFCRFVIIYRNRCKTDEVCFTAKITEQVIYTASFAINT